MSQTTVPAAAAASDPAVPLSEFARQVGPHLETTQVARNGRVVPQTRVIRPGTDEEVWLRLLRIRHPNERHSIAGWRALIAKYATEPAHPAHPRFGRMT